MACATVCVIVRYAASTARENRSRLATERSDLWCFFFVHVVVATKDACLMEESQHEQLVLMCAGREQCSVRRLGGRDVEKKNFV